LKEEEYIIVSCLS